jgi:hypothetical protein
MKNFSLIFRDDYKQLQPDIITEYNEILRWLQYNPLPDDCYEPDEITYHKKQGFRRYVRLQKILLKGKFNLSPISFLRYAMQFGFVDLRATFGNSPTHTVQLLRDLCILFETCETLCKQKSEQQFIRKNQYTLFNNLRRHTA